MALADINGDPIWTGSGARPKMVTTFDLDYLFHNTKTMPPFRTANDDSSPITNAPFSITTCDNKWATPG